ncbi:hypothetical protein [Streptomyces parvulus]|uniref:Uncharacterized protein n=1 Tax=Streptomyces parvulus TaxID=146923 RepID=A0A191UWV9_9ACTN|nr:hypothetical protein [Streptomyces parvulus]ANJ07150.1 hypothetical protein Spa2297_09120 [Streptomyces parvulus]GGR74391.1 hypothetical protein GCM10010220_28370 [Streptomyces parvulus]
MADDENTPPRAPDGLGERGLRLWTDTLAELDMDPDELVLLEEACRLADELDEMGTLLAGSSMLSVGSRGQQVANPLIREIRGHRLALSRVLRQLGATRPGEDEEERLTPSQRGRKAAMARHHGARSLAPVRPMWPPREGDAS